MLDSRKNSVFKFLEVKDKEMLDKAFAFRYDVFKDTEILKEYFYANNFEDGKEQDEYDSYSIHFLALDTNGEVSANVRLIYNSPIGYPTENNMKFDNSMFDRDKLGELSRIFVNTKYRDIRTTKFLIEGLNKLIYIKLRELNLQYTYGALEASFLRLLNMYKMPYELIGEKQLDGKLGLRYPCILYTEKFSSENPRLVELWERYLSENN